MVKLFLTTRWRYHLMKMILFCRLEASGYFWDRVCTVKETSLWIYGGKAIFYRLHSDLTETFKGTGNSRRDGTVCEWGRGLCILHRARHTTDPKTWVPSLTLRPAALLGDRAPKEYRACSIFTSTFCPKLLINNCPLGMEGLIYIHKYVCPWGETLQR